MDKRILILSLLALVPVGFGKWVAEGGMDPVQRSAQAVVQGRHTETVSSERRCRRVSRKRIACEDHPVTPYQVEVYDLALADRSDHVTGRRASRSDQQFKPGDKITLQLTESGLPFFKMTHVTDMRPAN
jgi:hypothetical protein